MVVSVAGAVTAALALASCGVVGGGSGGGYQLTAYFPRAVALYESSDVRVLGLNAGNVADVEVQGNRVKVVMEMSDDVPVPKDVNAMIVPQSLIGERYVQLFPAWKDGQPRIEPGATIPEARTSIPVEPDEALAALKEFIDTLDPKATGELVSNLAADLDGAGGDLNGALKGLAELASTVAEKDEELGRIIEQFDDFTTTLRTRETQLGRVMDSFATMTSILAEERRAIEGLVKGLGQVSGDALDLVSEHGAALDRDLQILTRTLQTVDVNLESVKQLLDAGPLLVTGMQGAHDPRYHRIDLRNVYGPTAQQALNAVLSPFGIAPGDVVCLPVDVECKANPQTSAASVPSVVAPAGPVAPAAPTVPGVSSPPTTAPTTATTQPRSPVDGILDLLGGGAYRPAAITPERSLAERMGSGVRRVGSFAGRAVRALFGGLS